jgi:DNA-binding transcriptional LysR family regulator
MVALPRHPLAAHPGPIPTSVLARHVQLVISDRSRLSEGKDFGVFSPRTWRLSDPGAKHAFLLAGLGWGGMPLDIVEADLASGALVPLTLKDTDTSTRMALQAVYRADSPPGPAGRWLIDRLKRSVGDLRMSKCTSGSASPVG